MGYWTYFKGEMDIELKEPHLSQLRSELFQKFGQKTVVVVEENSVTVDDEWKDRTGIIEDIVLFIKKYGVLKSGKISCYGEDSKDVWEIFISDNKPYIREHGNYSTLNRSLRKEKYGSNGNAVIEITARSENENVPTQII